MSSSALFELLIISPYFLPLISMILVATFIAMIFAVLIAMLFVILLAKLNFESLEYKRTEIQAQCCLQREL